MTRIRSQACVRVVAFAIAVGALTAPVSLSAAGHDDRPESVAATVGVAVPDVLPCVASRFARTLADAWTGRAVSLEDRAWVVTFDPRPLRSCVCGCGGRCQTDADCGPGGRCGVGITCCANSLVDLSSALAPLLATEAPARH